MRKKGLPSTTNYWQDWIILNSNKELVIAFDDVTTLGVDEDRITGGDINYIASLIQDYPWVLQTDFFRRELPLWIERWVVQARSGDRKAREKLRILYKAFIGDLRGFSSVEKVKEKIRGDIELFRRIKREQERSQRIKKSRKTTIDGIITSIAAELDCKLSPETIWQIYKVYRRVVRKCLPVLGSWVSVLDFLEVCRRSLHMPAEQVEYKDFIFRKL